MGSLQRVSEQQQKANERIDKLASQFLSEEVAALIQASTTYRRIIRSNDPDEFMDITLIQWDTCCASVLCLLREQLKASRVLPSQSLLIRICKLTARRIHANHHRRPSLRTRQG